MRGVGGGSSGESLPTAERRLLPSPVGTAGFGGKEEKEEEKEGRAARCWVVSVSNGAFFFSLKSLFFPDRLCFS